MKTLIIDTVDRLFPLCAAAVCKDKEISHVSDLGHGKGWGFLKERWSRAFNAINNMECAVVFVAHSKIKEVEKKHQKIDITQPDLPATGLGIVHDLSDIILYLGHDAEDHPKLFGKPVEDLIVGARGGIMIDNVDPTFESIDQGIKDAGYETGYEGRRPTILLYGPPKIGKSTLASMFPNPVIVDLEDGYKFLDVPEKHIVSSWDEFGEIIKGLNNPAEKENN